MNSLTPSPTQVFHTDAREYDPADVIAEALKTYVAGQQTDRIGIRCLRPLFTADGIPILNDRGQQKQAVLAGVFDREYIPYAAHLIAELNSRAADDPRDQLIAGAVGYWHCYWHVQLVVASISNRLLPGSQGTVVGPDHESKPCGIGEYTTFIGDLDPGERDRTSTETPTTLADVLSQVFTQLGVPRGAQLIQQSGRGAYLLVAIEPQPLSARSTLKYATRTLARLVAAAGVTVKGDPAVHDPPRILRIAGTTNHKPDADPTTPAWILRPWTPGVRTPWSIIKRLAAPSQPRLSVVQGGGNRRADHSGRPPLRDLFAAKGWLYRERPGGVADVRCPQAELHSDGRDAAILYPPREAGGAGWVKCLHAHCEAMTLADVYRALGVGQ